MIDPAIPSPQSYVFRILVHSLRQLPDDPPEGVSVALSLRHDATPVANEPALIYASHVQAGEVLSKVLARELHGIFDITKYSIVEIQETGLGLDASGQQTPQLAVHIQVPYFEAEGRRAGEFYMSWMPVQAPVSAEEISRAIHECAEAHRTSVKTSFGEELHYDEASILKLDGIIDRGWPLAPKDELQGLTMFFGSFLGEGLIALFGGAWAPLDQGWVVELKSASGQAVIARPFNKMQHRFMRTPDSSIADYYKTIKTVVEK